MMLICLFASVIGEESPFKLRAEGGIGVLVLAVLGTGDKSVATAVSSSSRRTFSFFCSTSLFTADCKNMI